MADFTRTSILGENFDRMMLFGTLPFLNPGKFTVAQNSLTAASLLEEISPCEKQKETDESVLLMVFISFFTVNLTFYGSTQHPPQVNTLNSKLQPKIQIVGEPALRKIKNHALF
jgi:hypothetical protein